MKIVLRDKVYLQRGDVGSFYYESKIFPLEFHREIFNNGGSQFFCLSEPDDAFRFDCEFKNPSNVEWLKSQDWILDYDKCASMVLSEIDNLLQYYNTKCSEVLDKLARQGENYLKSHYAETNIYLCKMNHKIISLSELARYHKGEIEFVFPKDYHGQTVSEKKTGVFDRLFGHGAW